VGDADCVVLRVDAAYEFFDSLGFVARRFDDAGAFDQSRHSGLLRLGFLDRDEL
jgi:hypothetical protein